MTLIGANGAGKSTLLMTICGNPRARTGSIRLDGDDITGLATQQIVRRGVAQVPEGRRIFPRMSVYENLQMGAAITGPAHFQHDLERVFTMFPRLAERREQRGGTLSGGEQQMLAIGRALMSRPRLLLLDEPSSGRASSCADLRGDRPDVREEGVTIFLVEQNAYHAPGLPIEATSRSTAAVLRYRPNAGQRGDPRRLSRRWPRMSDSKLRVQVAGLHAGDRRCSTGAVRAGSRRGGGRGQHLAVLAAGCALFGIAFNGAAIFRLCLGRW